MLLPLDKLRSLYEQIIKNAMDCEGLGTSIYIFATNESDTLCSVKMLTSLLKQDEMQYNFIPVFSNLHLLEELKKLNDNPFVRSLVFINCGGVLDLTQFWFYEQGNKIQNFVFDCHRPFNHNNIIDPLRKINFVHDGCESFNKYPTAEDIQIMQECQGDEDEDSDEYDQEVDSDEEEIKEELEDLKNESDDGEDVYGGDKVDKNAQAQDEDAEIIGADEDIDEVRVGVKRQRDGAEKVVDRRQLKRQKKALFQRYYQGNFYWRCSSWMLYQLAQQLNRESNDMLWLWILGMTDLVIHARSNHYSFDSDIIDCSNEVQRLNPHIYNKHDNEGPHFDPTSEQPETQAQNQQVDLFKLVNLQSRNKETGTILMEQELKLMLLRHWSLFDSLNNSNYLVSKLELWKEPGQKELKRLLATLGIPLDQAKQKFTFMDPVIRNEFKQKFLETAHLFSLDNIAINTFIRQVDPKTQVSAIDMAYALSSILESPKNLGKKEFGGMNFEENKNPNMQQNMLQNRIQAMGLNPGQKEDGLNALDQVHDCKYANFWVAYDALEKHNKNLLEMGIELAKEMQKAIVQIGTSIIDKKEVKIAQGFRYVFLENDFLKDIQLFQYPLALQKLALFVMETYKAKKLRSKDKPLVIGVKNSKSGRTLIVAVMGYTREAGSTKNDFGSRFRAAVEKTGARSKHDGFDASMIEIKNEDYRPFFEELASMNE